MSDRFLFRAWDKQDKRMIADEQEFIPLKITNKGVLRLNPHHEDNLYNLLPIEDRFILMQCTGLKNNNAELIFEGDVAIYEYQGKELKGEVIYKDGAFIVNDELLGYLLPDLEIIGNVYENAELLKTTC